MQAKGVAGGSPGKLDSRVAAVGFCGFHFGDAGLPGVNGGLRGVERPVAFVGFLALAELHHREYAGEVRGKMLEHVGNPFGLVSAEFGARDFGDEEWLIDIRESVVGLLENLRERLPAGPALAFAPVVAVDGDVVHVVVAGVVAGERGTLSCVRGVSGPDPFYVSDIFFAEYFHDVAEGFGHICVGVAGTFFTHAPVVPVAVCFVEGPEPDFFAVILDALGVVADVFVGLAVHQFLRIVAVSHPGNHQRGAVFLGDVGVFFGRVPVVDVEECKVADQVEVRALQILERLHVLLRGLRILTRATDPCADLERHGRDRCDTHREE